MLAWTPDSNATTIVVHDHPDELPGLEMGRTDHETIGRSNWLGARGFLRHDRNMTATSTFDKRLRR